VKKNVVVLIVLLMLVLNACTPTTPAPTPTATPLPTAVPVAPLMGLPQGTDGYTWWNDTVFYEIFVRSFYDSNGDGIGDFNGITQKLDYLQGLGVTGLWLMPIYPSPSYHGYDATDYYSVDPEYGTMDDFKNLLSEAHKRGIRVIDDLVLDYTSSQNPWFLDALDPNSAHHDWYIWSATDPGYPGPWGEQVWFPSGGKYFYALWGTSNPNLNYKNPAVTKEMDKVASFWLKNVGVDGFRLDAIKYLIQDGVNQTNTDATHAWLQQFRTAYTTANPNAMTVGELSGESAGVMASYTQGDQLDLTFDFGLARAFVSSAKSGNAGNANGQLRLSYNLVKPLQFAPFLANHDDDRLMTQLENDNNKSRVAASLLLTSPGVPFIYYGEELGLQGSGSDPMKRRPMQWSTDPNGGFSIVSPWEELGPNWHTNNVALESANPNSLLTWYQTLIHTRNDHAALRVGDLNVLTTLSSGLYSILRISKAEAVLVLINLTGAPISQYSLTISKSALAAGTYSVLPILGPGTFADLTTSASGGFSKYVPLAEVPAYGTFILQLHSK
jgi:alpha-amylase